MPGETDSRIKELKARIARAEDRITRVNTLDEYLEDLQIIQMSYAKIACLEKTKGEQHGFGTTR